MWSRNKTDADRIRASNRRFYGVACLVHGNRRCQCAEREAVRHITENNAERVGEAPPYGSAYGQHTLPGDDYLKDRGLED
jgi:hypothetical protein